MTPTRMQLLSKKIVYRVRNWKEYNRSLVNRGESTIWFSDILNTVAHLGMSKGEFIVSLKQAQAA
jgi:hypothetical protein